MLASKNIALALERAQARWILTCTRKKAREPHVHERGIRALWPVNVSTLTHPAQHTGQPIGKGTQQQPECVLSRTDGVGGSARADKRIRLDLVAHDCKWAWDAFACRSYISLG